MVGELVDEIWELLRKGQDVHALRLRYHKKAPHLDTRLLQNAFEAAEGRVQAARLNIGAWVEKGLFTKIGLQQSTHPAIAAHHARRFAGCKNVLEICTGLGFDTKALASVASHVTTLETDEWVAACAAHNLQLQNITNVKIINQAAEEFVAGAYLNDFDGLWADPSRRVADKRVKDGALYQPTLEWLLSLPMTEPIGIKISPALNIEDLPTGCTREWIGFGSECREQILWLRAGVPEGLVSLVDKGVAWNPRNLVTQDEIISAIPTEAPFYLIEPHGALSRSGGLASLYGEEGVTLADEDVVYGFSKLKPKHSPFYEIFEVFECAPLSRKKLIERIAKLGWNSRTEIKKRNIKDDPDEIFKALKLPKPDGTHTAFGVILLATIRGEPIVFLAQRVTKDGIK